VKTSQCAIARILIGSLIILAASSPLHASQFAKSLYKQGQAAEARQDYDAAFSDYRKAMLDDPSDLRYKTACERTRLFASELHLKRGKQLKENGNISGALTEFLRAAAIDPSNVSVEQAIAGLEGQITPNPEE
jgi:general secretion pathway protein D